MPKITIITVIHNLIKNHREHTFKACVDSVYAQNKGQIEHLVIDGGSTDGSLQILEEYKSKGWIKYISEADNGIYDAMNKGIRLAQGEYVWFVNSDDYILPGSVSALLSREDFGKVDVYICGVNEHTEKGRKVSTRIPYELDDKMYFGFMASHQGIIYKKALHQKLGEYNSSYKIAADWDFFLRVYEDKSCQIRNLYFSVVAFRLGGLSGNIDKAIHKQHLSEREDIISRYFPELTKSDCEFLSTAIWKSNDEIYKYFSDKKSEAYSQKLTQALKILCRRNPLDKAERIPFEFSKDDMINKLSDLPIIEPPYKEKDNKVVLCLASDANYEPHLYVAIKSVLNKISPNVTCYIYILDGGIVQQDNFYKLENEKVKIFFIDMREQFICASETRHITRATYYRLGIFWLFRKFDRVLYIDADSLLVDDIAKLYHLDIGDKLIAGAIDSSIWQKSAHNKPTTWNNFSGSYYDYFSSYLDLSLNRRQYYFNAGVILLNLEKMDLEDKRRRLCKLLQKDYYSHDQDILNCLFSENELYILPHSWNYYNVPNFLKETDYLREEEKQIYFNFLQKPSLVALIIKPWDREHLNCDFGYNYWEILRSSPYYDAVLSKLKAQTSSKQSTGKSIYKLFGCLPLLKIKSNAVQSSYKLFGFLPIIKTMRGKYEKIKVCGFPLFSIHCKKKGKVIKLLNLLPIMTIK